MPYQLVWLIFLLPVFSFVIISFFVRPFVNKESRVAGYITITALSGSLALSLWALTVVLAAPNHELPVPDISWLVIGDEFSIHLRDCQRVRTKEASSPPCGIWLP